MSRCAPFGSAVPVFSVFWDGLVEPSGHGDGSLVARGGAFTGNVDCGKLSSWQKEKKGGWCHRGRVDPVGHDIVGSDGSAPGTVRRGLDCWDGFTFANFDTKQRSSLNSYVTSEIFSGVGFAS